MSITLEVTPIISPNPSVYLSWNSNGGNPYYIYRDGVLIAINSINSLSYFDKEVSLGGTYTYWIIQVDSGGNSISSQIVQTSLPSTEYVAPVIGEPVQNSGLI